MEVQRTAKGIGTKGKTNNYHLLFPACDYHLLGDCWDCLQTYEGNWWSELDEDEYESCCTGSPYIKGRRILRSYNSTADCPPRSIVPAGVLEEYWDVIFGQLLTHLHSARTFGHFRINFSHQLCLNFKGTIGLIVLCVLVFIGAAGFYLVRKYKRARAEQRASLLREPTVAWSSVGQSVRIELGPMFFTMDTVDDSVVDEVDEEEENDGMEREIEAQGPEWIPMTTFRPRAQGNENESNEEETGL